jgi:DGQHR domain-containing protein
MDINVNAFKITQQIGQFFVAKIKAEDLVKLTYSDVRALQNERDVETYLGIQRPLNERRAKEIQEYVKNYDAAFPSSVILHIDEEFISWDSTDNNLTFTFDEKISPAKILDGQHRIAGFMDLKTGKPIEDVCYFKDGEDTQPFELMITVFVGLDLPEQANIFATVNLKQTKVSKSLVYDLEAYTKTRSPQKTAHDIVVALDLNSRSPFYGRIKRLGYKNDSTENLTQAMLVEEFVKLISKEPMKDRDILIRKEKKSFSKFRKSELERYPIESGRIFRDMFIERKDESILITAISFFKAVEKKWPNSWNLKTNDSVLNKTVGVKALFRVLKELMKGILSENYSTEPVRLDVFSEMLGRVDVNDEYFINLEAVSTSEGKIYRKINDSFMPD